MRLRKFALALFMSLMIVLQCVPILNAAGLDNALTWEVKDDRTGKSFNDITTFNNKLIAVGTNGLIMTSNDGLKWSEAKVDTKAHFIGIVTDGKKAVAATNDGNIFISADGENWNVKSIAVGVPVNKIVFINNKFILLGNNFTVLFSDDAVKWDNMSKNYDGVKYKLEGIAYNPDKSEWVLGVEKSLVVTNDFVTFENFTLPEECYLNDIAYLKGKYIIGAMFGYIFDTTNLKDFNKSQRFSGTYLENFNHIIIASNYFLALGQQGILIQGTSAKDCNKIKNSVRGSYISGGVTIFNYDYYLVSNAGSIEKSKSDSSYWSNVLSGNSDTITIIPAEDKFLGVSRSGDVYLLNTDFSLKKVANLNEIGNDVYIFEDGKHKLKGAYAFTAESLDLINWKSREAANEFLVADAKNFNNTLYLIGYGGDEFGDGIAYYNDEYKKILTQRFSQNSMEVFNDKLIVAGNYGEGYIIDKNNNYEKININKETTKKVKYLNNILVAVNNGGKICTSSDGINWVTREIDSKLSINDVAYANNMYVIVGNNGTILTSTDLVNWYKNESGVGNNLTSIAFNNGKFVIGGEQNTILVSKDLTTSSNKVVSNKVTYDPTKIYIYVNNEEVVFDQEPIIENGTTLAPLRFVFETLGAKVTWDDATRTAIGVKDGIEVKVKIDSNTAYVNGQAKTLDVPAKIVNERTLVPLRFISESFNLKVTWEDFSRSAYIDENK